MTFFEFFIKNIFIFSFFIRAVIANIIVFYDKLFNSIYYANIY